MTEKDKIIEIFFGIQDGELPKEYLNLKQKYEEEKMALQEGKCLPCQLNSLMRRYKKKLL